MMTLDEEENEEDVMISIGTAEKVLIMRDHLMKREGRIFGFRETIHFLLEEFIEQQGILDDNHSNKKKNV